MSRIDEEPNQIQKLAYCKEGQGQLYVEVVEVVKEIDGEKRRDDDELSNHIFTFKKSYLM